jgi:tripartite-type tricarboxylate transporter receptor subunit TctC
MSKHSIERVRRDLLRGALAGLIATALGCGLATAADWPTKMIRAIVPLTAGSATDIVARTVLNQVSIQLGQPIIVENRPGAGNTIGMAAVAGSEPDGYTIMVNSSSHTIVAATFANLNFDTLRDFAPVIPLGNMPSVYIVSPGKGYKTLGDLVAFAKSHPGVLNYSTAGTGNFSHFGTEIFRRIAGFDAVQVPAKGAPEAVTEVLAGRIDFFLSPLIVAQSSIADGKLQALAVSGAHRASALPNVPTTTEAGFAGSAYDFWVALFVPAKTPTEIVEKLYAETEKAVKNPAVQDKLAKLGVDPMFMSRPDFAKQVSDEIALNTKMADEIGIKIK